MTSSNERDSPDASAGVEPSLSAVAPGEDQSHALPTAETDLADDSQPTAEWAGDAAASSTPSFSPGQVVGDRYRIRVPLGRGGMGEVWQAFDLKLRVEVALKSLRKELFADERGLALLRREVLSAREVVSPNVCRVFDLQVAEGQELVSMEYIDGRTLLGELSERGPLELAEAGKIASQLLAGLAAIHDAGLVHRDLKPENVMITRSGRVVIMDFGIAKAMAEASTGTVAGTPAYMAPEQQRGDAVDARADVFAMGVMLAEMVGPEGIGNLGVRRQLWAALRKQPPQVPEGPWRDVIRRAVSADPEDRYRSAQALSRALEEVTLRVEGAETMRPYPGLASFTEADAEFFFGREAEVEALWKKLQRPHLLGLIGPSGAGKSSFLHAGLLPVRPEGWRVVVCQPDDGPFRSLAQILVLELSGDTDAMQDLVRFDDLDAAVRVIARWREGAEEALLVIDQFEELFTLNPPETQRRFAELLGRLPVEADVRVLLSMRDDFLFRCHEQPALAPLFSELTPLGAPGGGALRRALVQPALACGYRFEDVDLVEEMVGEVTEERGALPLLAFAASRLWEKRDRGTGFLTRRAYEEIGGVGGALAQHAEATLEHLGATRRDQVREIFRNLVTSEGTRATRDIDELLSVFDEPEAAREVVNTLINARLLTSYEVPAAAEEPESNRVEIVHESLLAAWPRLVRWQTQDADGAQLRDQVRQASKAWEDRGRPDDLLWTGTSWREHQLWRERYPGGLSDAEEAFSQAMAAKAGRRRRQRRTAVAAFIAVLLVVLTLFGVLWRRSDLSRQEAVEEARRAEASKLLALGQLELDTSPTSAVAYALASLELVDTASSRRFALEALWQGPTAITLGTPVDRPLQGVFSPNGEWFAVGGFGCEVALYSRQGGGPRVFDAHDGRTGIVGFALDSERLVTAGRDEKVRVWSVLGGDALQTIDLGGELSRSTLKMPSKGNDLLIFTPEGEARRALVRAWSMDGRDPRALGRTLFSSSFDVDPHGEWIVFGEGERLFLTSISEHATETPEVVGNHDADIIDVRVFPDGQKVAASDRGGEIRIWSLAPRSRRPLRTFKAGEGAGFPRRLRVGPRGSWLAFGLSNEIRLWRLDGPPGAKSMPLRPPGGVSQINDIQFDPTGQWLLTTDFNGVTIWPLARSYPAVSESHSPAGSSWNIAVAPDGSWVAGVDPRRGNLWVFPLDGSDQSYSRPAGHFVYGQISAHPDGRHVLVGSSGAISPGLIYLVPIAKEGEVRVLEGFESSALATALSADGRLAAAAAGIGRPEDGVIRIWDLESGGVRVLDPGDRVAISSLFFTPEGTLISGGAKGVRLWNLQDGTSHSIREWEQTNVGWGVPSEDGTRLLSFGYNLSSGNNGLVLHDLASGESRPLVGFGKGGGVLSRDGEWVLTGSHDGVVRLGPVSSEDPHLLLGHKKLVAGLQFTPDGRSVISSDIEGTVRIWQIPDGRPFHTLPLDELLQRLRALTNLRAVRDEGSASGYALEPEPFEGWEEVPTW